MIPKLYKIKIGNCIFTVESFSLEGALILAKGEAIIKKIDSWNDALVIDILIGSKQREDVVYGQLCRF